MIRGKVFFDFLVDLILEATILKYLDNHVFARDAISNYEDHETKVFFSPFFHFTRPPIIFQFHQYFTNDRSSNFVIC